MRLAGRVAGRLAAWHTLITVKLAYDAPIMRTACLRCVDVSVLRSCLPLVSGTTAHGAPTILSAPHVASCRPSAMRAIVIPSGSSPIVTTVDWMSLTLVMALGPWLAV